MIYKDVKNMTTNEELIQPDGKRLDGRMIDEMRPIVLKVGVLEQADGSAYIEHGNNKILVAVYGPREIHPRHLVMAEQARVRVEYRLATFSVGQRKSPAPKRREHELSKIIQEAVEPSIFVERFPRAGIDIYVLVLDADGGTRAASITATSLALADTGLPLRGLVAAVAAGKAGGKVILDLFDTEDKVGEGDLPIAVMSNSDDITLCQMDGRMTRDEVKEAIDMAIKGCHEIHQLQREALLKKYENMFSVETEEEEIETDEELDSEETQDDELDSDEALDSVEEVSDDSEDTEEQEIDEESFEED